MIFYEAPHKLTGTLADLRQVFGGTRRICLCRELTKLHEEALRMTLDEAVAYYESQAPRGEYVLIVEGAQEAAEPAVTQNDAVARVQALITQGYSKKDAVRQVAAETGFPKNALYDAVLKQ